VKFVSPQLALSLSFSLTGAASPSTTVTTPSRRVTLSSH
jgi:hypothetical protein